MNFAFFVSKFQFYLSYFYCLIDGFFPSRAPATSVLLPEMMGAAQSEDNVRH